MTREDTCGEGAYERILGELMQALDRGQRLSLEDVIRLHPGDGEAARRACADFEQYLQMLPALSGLGLGSEASASLEAGARLGDFEVVGLLGVGGMGTVYRARQLSLGGREVALKVMPGAAGRASGRFQREALTLAGLHHPHLAEVHGFGAELGRLFLAMKLVEGPTLHAVLERLAARGKRPDRAEQRRIVEWIGQVASALGLVHANELVHRDVKPANIVIDGRSRGPAAAGEAGDGALPDGAAVLVDFGLVRPADPELATLTHGSPATPSYAPPEQLLGATVDPSADVFSLGVTLHDLLAARLPADRQRASAGLEALADLADVDPDLSAVVARAADPDARWRYADAAELHADLQAWLDGRPVAARRPPLGERARRALQRNPWLSAVALGGLIGFAVLGLAVHGVIAMVAAARAAEVALERRHVRELRDALERIPAPLDRILLAPRVRTAAESVRSAQKGSARGVRAGERPALGAVLAALDANDRGRALTEAATHLRRSAHLEEGEELEPLVADYFVGEVERAAEALREGTWGQDLALHERALLLAARALYEIDRESPDFPDAPWRAELREPLLELLDLLVPPEVGDLARARLLVVSALSGCGTVGDAPRLLPLASRGDLEDRRMALQAIERIVRRAHQRGELAELTPALVAETWEVSGGPILEWLGDSPKDRERGLLFEAAQQLLLAELLAYRRMPEVGGASILPELLAAVASCPERRPLFLAAAADPRFPSVAQQGAVWNREWKRAGRALGLFGDPTLVERVRESTGESGDPELDRGLALGQAEARGYLPEEVLDPETLLGSTGGPEVAEATCRPAQAFEHGSMSLRPPDHAHQAPARPLAFWDFDLDPRYGGTAGPHEATDCAAGRERDEYLKLWRFGRSTVRLPFAFSSSEADVPRRLYLAHQLGSRTYFPYQGEAFLEVRLNGQSLGSLRCSRREGEESVVNLPQDVLRDGENLIVLRLTEDTTTTYRLYEAWVE